MRIGYRTRAAALALLAGATLFIASSSDAMRVEFHPESVASVDGTGGGGTGFDNSTLGLEATFTLTDEWLSAGVPMPGETFALELSEVQTLRDGTQQGLPGEELNVMEPWISTVEWTVTNTTGLEGPALLFFSGLQEFAVPGAPTTPALDQYLPSDVGILMTEDFTVASYQVGSSTYYYLGFLIEDISSPVNITFEYEVTRDIIGFETPEYGTPILQMNAFFVPEPSPASMMVVGLVGLAYVGRRRSA